MPCEGIVLAGGTGSRLWPITRGVSKQLLPVFDKPMIHYPIGTLMAARLREILIISARRTSPRSRPFGDGSGWASLLLVRHPAQPGRPRAGVHHGEDFLAGPGAALVLGDNIFHGPGLGRGSAPSPRSTGDTSPIRCQSQGLWRGRLRQRGRVTSIEEASAPA